MQDFRAKSQVKIIIIIIIIIIILIIIITIIIITINFLNRFRMITAAILVCQNNKTVAMLMHQKKKKLVYPPFLFYHKPFLALTFPYFASFS